MNRFYRLFLAVVCLVSSTAVFAQSSDYVKAMERLLNSGSVNMVDNLKDAGDSYVELLVQQGYTRQKATALAEEYFSTQFISDMAVLLAPYFEPNLSIATIDEVVAKLQDPAVKRAMQSTQNAAANISEIMTNSLQPALMAMMSGQTPEPVALDSRVPASYVKLVNEYAEASDVASVFSGVLEPLKSIFDNPDIPAEQRETLNKMFDGLVNYLSANYTNMVANSCYGIVSEADLTEYTRLAKTPLWQTYMDGSMKAVNAMMSDVMGLGMKILQGFQNWAEQK